VTDTASAPTDEPVFTADGERVPSVTAAEMTAVDRAATDEAGLHLLSMMENAGRNLARETVDRAPVDAPVVVFVGGGGNGGGGLVAARHLANAGRDVTVVTDRDPGAYDGVPARQLDVLSATDATVTTDDPDPTGSHGATGDRGAAGDRDATPHPLAVDALVGYGLREAARGRAAELIEATADFDRVVSLDVPSGLDATTGERPGVAVAPDAVLTLALPKPGLGAVDADLRLADIGIPAGVYDRADVAYRDPFGGRYRVDLAVESAGE
jgi:NAD(P)H-hydrate epimerase